METVGFVGVGKIGLPICENLIKSGYRVLGYRRSSLAEFEKVGGVAARSPAEIGAQAEIVFSCLPRLRRSEERVQQTAVLRLELVNQAAEQQDLPRHRGMRGG